MFNPQPFLKKITLPEQKSHKGQNGKLLIIGGSELFHAASKWSLDVASKFVDMVFYASVPSNNELIHQAKGQFWNGIVINRDDIETYIKEADCVLIGPGMTRTSDTETITNQLLKTFPTKKWVIDAGALQMIEPQLITASCVITPHHQEFMGLYQRLMPSYAPSSSEEELFSDPKYLLQASQAMHQAIVVVKGPHDRVFKSTGDDQTDQMWEITGGNAGMTKGGTGDVLAGLVAALYCTQDAVTAAVVGSYINKKAGERLWQRVGPYFNASDLVQEIPATLWQEWQTAHQNKN